MDMISDEKPRKRWDCIYERVYSKDRKKITGAELGVFKGKMSRNLLRMMPNLELYMIDRWTEYTEQEKTGDPFARLPHYESEIWSTAKQKVNKIVNKFKGRGKVIVSDTAKAAGLYEDRYFDFVFIDAGHSYESVKSDIEAWMSKVKCGGYLCGHDITRKGVSDAVLQIFEENNIEYDDDKTWFVRLA